MKPTRVVRGKKGFQVVHRCIKCGKQQLNRAALNTVQDDLEALLLELLAKQVEERPESAAALQRRLEASESSGSWTQADARRWWEEWGAKFHERQEARTRNVSPSSPSVVVRERDPQLATNPRAS